MKILIALMGLIAATGAFAEDVPSVTERVSCADIQAMISELAAIEEPTDDEIAELYCCCSNGCGARRSCRSRS